MLILCSAIYALLSIYRRWLRKQKDITITERTISINTHSPSEFQKVLLLWYSFQSSRWSTDIWGWFCMREILLLIQLQSLKSLVIYSTILTMTCSESESAIKKLSKSFPELQALIYWRHQDALIISSLSRPLLGKGSDFTRKSKSWQENCLLRHTLFDLFRYMEYHWHG
jgi:hypothetical protein